MILLKSSAILAVLISLCTTSFAFDAGAKSNLAVYYGQGAYQNRLSHFCEETSLDIINVGFVNSLPALVGQWPGSNFGNQCDGSFFAGSTLLSGCHQIWEDIPVCQAMGKKVLLSIGGDTASPIPLTDAVAEWFADFLWYSFGPNDGNSVYNVGLYNNYVSEIFPRPFQNVTVDGFDFDIEHNGGHGYATMINRLRSHFAKVPARQFYISGAPQCPIPDQQLGYAIKNSVFDFIWVQFYNTQGCSAADFANGSGNFNYDDWVDVIKKSANPSAKLYIGLPASKGSAGSGFYITPSQVKPMVEKYMSLYPKTFGGIMLWEATSAENNVVDGYGYSEYMKKILYEYAPPPKPTPTPTVIPTVTPTVIPSTTSKQSSTTTSSICSSKTHDSDPSTTSSSVAQPSSTTSSSVVQSSSTTSSSSVLSSSTTSSPSVISSSTPYSSKTTGLASSSHGAAPSSSGKPSSTAKSVTPSGTPAQTSTILVIPTPESSASTRLSSTSTEKSTPIEHSTGISSTTSSLVLSTPKAPTRIQSTKTRSPSGSVLPTITISITGTPSVTPAPSSTQPLTITTVIVTSYTSICPTGFTTITTTYTTYVCPETSATATPTPGITNPAPGPFTTTASVPEGWTTTVTVCTHCAATPTTVTLTLPCSTTTAEETPVAISETGSVVASTSTETVFTTVTFCKSCGPTGSSVTLTLPVKPTASVPETAPTGGAGTEPGPNTPSSSTVTESVSRTSPTGNAGAEPGPNGPSTVNVTKSGSAVASTPTSKTKAIETGAGSGRPTSQTPTFTVQPSTTSSLSHESSAPSGTQTGVAPIYTGAGTRSMLTNVIGAVLAGFISMVVLM